MTTPEQPQTPEAPKYDARAPHHARPRLRPVRLFPAQAGEHQLMGISDARQISEKAVLTTPAAQVVLPLLDGTRTVDEVVKQVGRGLTRDVLEQLVAQLDDAGLLFGPTFDAIVARIRADFDGSPNLPPASTAQFADAAGAAEAGSPEAFQALSPEAQKAASVKKTREVFDEWIAMALKDAANPSFDALPKAVVVPHLDYQRGWINYASVWGRMRVAERPDRVVVLGTNHFGEATGVCGCDKGYESLFGTCELDAQLVDGLKRRLGAENAGRLFEHKYDHEREHSVELQVPWIQHCLGADESGRYPRIFGALVHDPTVNNGESYDGSGVGFEPFVNALRETIESLPGRTLVVSSADLSHVGPAFGDPLALAGDDPQVAEARNNVFRHDRDMINIIAQNKPDELINAMSWQGNHTRWCSIGNITAAMKVARPSKVDVLNFAGAMDEQGTALVTCVAVAMS
ncbi:MAG TPA: AmmeMemoRadiSam system protein B [Phycisphaerales bacterium]|nr:AmmeMemoRadiSam system protein B [Phycisphaerales bacterium]